MSEHGLRDMTVPESEIPLPTKTRSKEGRHARPDERRIEGLLIAEDGEHPIICLDVAFSGVRVRALDGFAPELGELVEIRVTMDGNSFQDDCLVVETSQGAEGTIIHLAM